MSEDTIVNQAVSRSIDPLYRAVAVGTQVQLEVTVRQ